MSRRPSDESYEVTIIATVLVDKAEDETDAAEQAKCFLDMCSEVQSQSVQSIRKVG